MAFENLLMRLIAQIAKSEAKKDLLSQYGPPSRGDILHDGLVGAGETWGGILGTAAGITGGEAVAGPPGAVVGGTVLGPSGALAGGWAAHGAYLGGQRVRDALMHPENAPHYITPAMGPDDELSPFVRTLQSGVGNVGQPSEPPVRYLGRVQNPLGGGMAGWTGNLSGGNSDSNVDGSNGFNGDVGGASARTPVAPFATGAPPVPFLPPIPKDSPGGLPGLMIDAGLDPSNPDQPPAGGLLGLMQEYLRNNPAGNS